MGSRACTIDISGRGAAWLARLLGVQEVPSSNLGGPTKFLIDLQPRRSSQAAFWRPTGVQNGPAERPPDYAKTLLASLEPLSSYKKPDKPDISILNY